MEMGRTSLSVNHDFFDDYLLCTPAIRNPPVKKLPCQKKANFNSISIKDKSVLIPSVFLFFSRKMKKATTAPAYSLEMR